MFTNTIKLTIALSLVSLFTSSTNPMAAANPVTKRAAMELLKKGMEKGTTALHWGISVVPFWETARDLYFDVLRSHHRVVARKQLLEQGKAYKELDVETKIENWLRDELKKQGFTNWQTVHFIPYLMWSAESFSDKQFITYPASEVKKIVNEMNNTEENSLIGKINTYFGYTNGNKPHINEDDYNVARGSLSHEKTHLEEGHYEKIMALNVVMPFITHIAWKKLNPIPMPNISDPKLMFLFKNLSKIITGFSKFSITSFACWSLAYLCEKRADEGIIDDPLVLEAFAVSVAGTPRLWDVHGHPANRVRKLQERAAQLRAAQQKI